MSKDIFDRIVELEGTAIPFTAEELLLLVLSASTDLEIKGEITNKEQKTVMGVVTSAIDYALDNPEETKERIKIARLSVHHTQKIAKALKDEDPRKAIEAFMKAILDRPDKD